MLFLMGEARYPVAIEIRPAVPEDANGIARAFLESVEYHAELDPERYLTPAVDTISARYRDGLQHSSNSGREGMTLVAELNGKIVGFIDAHLEPSPDAMHRKMTYCHIDEIAVSRGHRNQGIGGRLLRAAEDWGTGSAPSSHHWNITPQTPAPVCSIRIVWAIAWRPLQP
jgi:GNAT superfamily N-acetyltransferase